LEQTERELSRFAADGSDPGLKIRRLPLPQEPLRTETDRAPVKVTQSARRREFEFALNHKIRI
jgi:hypothetical protein